MKRISSLALLLLLSACATVSSPRPPVHLVIVGTTDVHGWFAGHTNGGAPYGGLAVLQSYVNALRAENGDRVVLVDSGDMFQGTLESNDFEGEPMVRAYNAMGYSAAAVGNHEFDYGPEGPDSIVRKPGQDPLGALKRNASLAKFPFLSANMTEKATGRTPAWARPYTLIEAGGVRLGIVGLSTPDTPEVTVASNVAALNFSDPVPAAVDAARALRRMGADAVIVIAHIGGRCSDVTDVRDASSCDPKEGAMQFLRRLPPGTIDAYFAGHTHQQMRQFINGVPAVQGRAYGAEFSTLDLWIDPEQHRVDAARTDIRPLTMICEQVYEGTDRCDSRGASDAGPLVPRRYLGRTITAEPTLTALIQPYLDLVAAKRGQSIAARAAAPFGRSGSEESALGDLLADILRLSTGADIALLNSGAIRTALRAGDLVYSDIYEVIPFENYPAMVSLTGAEILELLRLTTGGDRGILQVSGLRYTFDAARDGAPASKDRRRLVSATLADGSPIDPQKTYRVVMPDFLANGGDGFLPVTSSLPPGRITLDQSHALHDLFAEKLRTLPQPLTPKLDGRITVLNAPPRRPPE